MGEVDEVQVARKQDWLNHIIIRIAVVGYIHATIDRYSACRCIPTLTATWYSADR
jgi:hypothetical protein